MERRRELADFLTKRRAALGPTDVGLPEVGGRRRRTPGLRREELASLAGLSVDWYIRLEQGRAERPSAGVLDALASALRLSDDERHHLYALARGERPPLLPSPTEEPDESLLRILASLPEQPPAAMPAMLLGRRWDVLAWNRPLAELLVPFDHYPAGQRNLVRLTFLDDRYRARYADWSAVAEETVANFRASVARHLDLPDVQSLVDELTTQSEDFAHWWAEHAVREKVSGTKTFHWQGAEVAFRYDTLLAPSSPDQRLITYHRE